MKRISLIGFMCVNVVAIIILMVSPPLPHVLRVPIVFLNVLCFIINLINIMDSQWWCPICGIKRRWTADRRHAKFCYKCGASMGPTGWASVLTSKKLLDI